MEIHRSRCFTTLRTSEESFEFTVGRRHRWTSSWRKKTKFYFGKSSITSNSCFITDQRRIHLNKTERNDQCLMIFFVFINTFRFFRLIVKRKTNLRIDFLTFSFFTLSTSKQRIFFFSYKYFLLSLPFINFV